MFWSGNVVAMLCAVVATVGQVCHGGAISESRVTGSKHDLRPPDTDKAASLPCKGGVGSCTGESSGFSSDWGKELELVDFDDWDGELILPLRNKSEYKALGMDQAQLIVDSGPLTVNVSLNISLQNTNCWRCRPLYVMFDTAQSNSTKLMLYANHSTKISITNMTSKKMICSVEQAVREHGSYRYLVNPNGTCTMIIEDNGSNSFLPILYVCVLLIGLALVWILLKFAYRKGFFDFPLSAFDFTNDRLVNSDLGSTQSVVDDPKKRKKPRFKSLDAFRGLSLCLMIFVNNGGGGYWFFHHSEWNGLTIADLVFPWFIFIMGAVIPVIHKPGYWDTHNRWRGLYNILVRAIRLFVLGLMVNTVDDGNDITLLRIPGVLQRFAITYLVVAVFDLVFSSIHRVDLENVRFAGFTDLLSMIPHLSAVVVLLTLHAVVTLAVPYHYGDFANCPTGYIGPAGLQEPPELSSCTGGIARYIDTAVLGYNHYYSHGTCKHMYHCASFDPEGILGYLTSIALCFLGFQAGKILICYQRPKSRCLRWFGWAVFWGALAMILTLCSQNDGFIPINKNLWSVSFVISMAATANLLLIACHLLIDVYGLWSGAPFIYPGMNSIVVYVGSEVLHKLIPISFSVSYTHLAQLFMALWSTTFWVLTAFYFHCKEIFISV